jgi:hypothetical protein
MGKPGSQPDREAVDELARTAESLSRPSTAGLRGSFFPDEKLVERSLNPVGEDGLTGPVGPPFQLDRARRVIGDEKNDIVRGDSNQLVVQPGQHRRALRADLDQLHIRNGRQATDPHGPNPLRKPLAYGGGCLEPDGPIARLERPGSKHPPLSVR